MPKELACIILAAGGGTRMKSRLPKVLHRIGHEPLIAHVLRAASALSPQRMVTVVAPGMDDVRAAATKAYPACAFAVQEKQLGTGHAVASARAALKDFSGTALILFGDTPLITPETLKRLLEAAQNAAVAVLGFRPLNPIGYGRLVMEGGELTRIVECKDAGAQEKNIALCNAGVMAVSAEHLFPLLDAIGNKNASGEYYLTDIIAAACARGLRCVAAEGDAEEVMGINSRAQLAEAEAALQRRLRARALEAGATLVAPDTVFLAADTQLAADVIVQPYVVFGPGVRVGEGTEIRSYSHIEGAQIGPGCTIGPFARLRPGAVLEQGAHVGNFVEIKQSRVGAGAKINHLSYVGDAEVGAGANVGAGTITCNYDGTAKHKTTIGEGAFIGSNTALVAPVTVGAGAVVGAGSVITEDVPPATLAIARGKQVVKKKK